MPQEAAPHATGARELCGIQILRAVAALAVVSHHTLEISNGARAAFSPDWLTTSGAAGVDIFFVISGFIMLYTSFPHARPPLRPGVFLFRRVTRIYPFYWTCCLAMLAIGGVGYMHNHKLALHEILTSLALLPSSRLIIDVSWTLVYEMYFYLIFAALLPFGSALVSAIGTTIAIVSLALIGETLEPGTLRSFLVNPVPVEFVLGLWLALAFRASIARQRRWPVAPVWTVPGVALLALAPLFVPHATTGSLPGWSRVLAWGFPSVLIVAASLSIGIPRNNMQRGLVILGDASYALYLTHAFVMIGYSVTLRLEPVSDTPQILIVPVVVLLAIMIGIVAHRLVENRMLRLVRGRTGRVPVSDGYMSS